MKCTVEYMFKPDTEAYKESSIFAQFSTVDQAMAFISDMKIAFANSIEWMYIHLENA
jgi:hypothetical protein